MGIGLNELLVLFGVVLVVVVVAGLGTGTWLRLRRPPSPAAGRSTGRSQGREDDITVGAEGDPRP